MDRCMRRQDYSQVQITPTNLASRGRMGPYAAQQIDDF
jgi:hypothetical protein